MGDSSDDEVVETPEAASRFRAGPWRKSQDESEDGIQVLVRKTKNSSAQSNKYSSMHMLFHYSAPLQSDTIVTS